MSDVASVLQLHDVDLILSELRDARVASRLKKLGFEPQSTTAIERTRAKLVTSIDRRWLNHYERALGRYGRAVAVVRQRVCQGCFITLPTSAAPSPDDSLTVCESCGRILYWR